MQFHADQTTTLGNAVDKRNQHFWPTLLQPNVNTDVEPPYFSHGDISEVQHLLKFTHRAWFEILGAIEILRDIVRPQVEP